MTWRVTKCWMVFVASLLAYGTAVAGPWVLAPREFSSEVRGSTFSSETFYDDDGLRPNLAHGGTYESRTMRWSSELGWKKRASFRIDIPFESVTRRFDSPAFELTRTGFSDLLLGLNVRILDGPTALSAEIGWKAPTGYNKDLAVLTLGDGRQDGIGFIHYGTAIKSLAAFVQAGAGYRMRLESYGNAYDQTLMTADVGRWFGPSLLISGSYRGRFDVDPVVAGADPAFTSSNGKSTQHVLGPEIRYRVDDHLDIFAGSLHSVSGQNALHVDQLFVGVTTKKTQLNRLQGFIGNKSNP